MTAQRADARRNYALILAVAEEEVAAHGADASLERIARTAGVGSATVRRHFPGRRALLAAVFSERIEALCGRAAELAAASDGADASAARAALLDWLGELTTYSASARGMADALVQDAADTSGHVSACGVKLTGAAAPLVDNAVRAGAVAPDLTVTDLVTLVTGIVLATENHQDPAAEAHRMLALAVAGISPRK